MPGEYKKPVIIGAVLSVFFLAVSYPFWDYAFDDTFIIFRYSKNLAQGHGLTWNPGEDPVDGFTSFIWVLLNAAAIYLNLDPLIFSKAMSMLSVLVIIWALVFFGRGMHWVITFIVVSSIAASPVFAYMANTALDTCLTCALIMLLGWISLKIAAGPSTRLFHLFFATGLVSMWARPDSGAFVFGAALGITALLLGKREYRKAVNFVLSSLPALVIGSAYLAWKLHYFGHVLPTSFHLKMRLEEYFLPGALYVYGFIKLVLLPYLVLVAVLFVKNLDKERLLHTAPILCGCFLFGVYLLNIISIQGYLWRFILPVYPVFLLSLVYYFRPLDESASPMKSGWASALIVPAFLAWSLHLFPAAIHVRDITNTRDRIKVGKKLADIHGTMLVSESGTLPYYSGWRSADTVGLTSEEIALNGLSREHMQSLEPDMAMVHVTPPGILKCENELCFIIFDYLAKNNFAAVAAIHKGRGSYHFYFARKDSEIFHEIVERLQNVEGVEYGDLERRMLEEDIPVFY